MARVNLLQKKDDLAPEHQPVFDAIAQSRGRVGGPFAVLLHSPQVAGRTAHLGTYLRFESTRSPKDTELVIITTSREFDCELEWGGHVALARQAGVREEAIAAIRDRHAPQGLTPEEALIVSYVQQLLRAHRVSEATYLAMQERFGVQGLVELTATIGYYGMLACSLNAFAVEPAAGAERLPV